MIPGRKANRNRPCLLTLRLDSWVEEESILTDLHHSILRIAERQKRNTRLRDKTREDLVDRLVAHLSLRVPEIFGSGI